MWGRKKTSNISVHRVRSDDNEEQLHFPTEFRNFLEGNGIQPHVLTLKIGAIVMRLHLNTKIGSLNGTEVRVWNVHSTSLDVQVNAGPEDNFIAEAWSSTIFRHFTMWNKPTSISISIRIHYHHKQKPRSNARQSVLTFRNDLHTRSALHGNIKSAVIRQSQNTSEADRQTRHFSQD